MMVIFDDFLNAIERVITEEYTTIAHASNAGGGLESWFQVEITHRLYQEIDNKYALIQREVVYDGGGSLYCDFVVTCKDDSETWVELKVCHYSTQAHQIRNLFNLDCKKLSNKAPTGSHLMAILISICPLPPDCADDLHYKGVFTNDTTFHIYYLVSPT